MRLRRKKQIPIAYRMTHQLTAKTGPYTDEGHLDFGRDHLFRDGEGDLFVLPESLVVFIQGMAKGSSE